MVWNGEAGGLCQWRVENSEIHYLPMTDQTKQHFPVGDPRLRVSKAMMAAERAGMRHVVAKPIRRVDEDGAMYDVTIALMLEMVQFPFALRDDLVDATSRIHDIGAMPPIKYESWGKETSTYPDS